MRYFITGVTGTLGSLVCDKLLQDPSSEVVGFSRDECKQAKIPPHPRLTLYLGDIRDQPRLIEATRKADLIFHFAALKHVDKLETNPEESVATNILGTMNVLHAQRVHGIARVVLSSTDKAAYPINTYGMSKGIAERLTLRNPNNVVCRYGNVLASRGSCVEAFVSSLRLHNRVNLTDPNMTRFWITPEEARDFVVASAARDKGGLCVPIMKAAPLHLLAQAVADCLEINSYDSQAIAVRLGEKTHECLKTAYEGEELHSHLAHQFSQEELRMKLKPIIKGLS